MKINRKYTSICGKCMEWILSIYAILFENSNKFSIHKYKFSFLYLDKSFVQDSRWVRFTRNQNLVRILEMEDVKIETYFTYYMSMHQNKIKYSTEIETKMSNQKLAKELALLNLHYLVQNSIYI